MLTSGADACGRPCAVLSAAGEPHGRAPEDEGLPLAKGSLGTDLEAHAPCRSVVPGFDPAQPRAPCCVSAVHSVQSVPQPCGIGVLVTAPFPAAGPPSADAYVTLRGANKIVPAELAATDTVDVCRWGAYLRQPGMVRDVISELCHLEESDGRKMICVYDQVRVVRSIELDTSPSPFPIH